MNHDNVSSSGDLLNLVDHNDKIIGHKDKEKCPWEKACYTVPFTYLINGFQ